MKSIAAALLILGATLADTRAQDAYPACPIRIIVPSTPGGGSDISARLIAQEFTKRWGQSAVVENRAGAGTIVGTDLVAKAPPDGYTLLMTPGAFATNPSTYKGNAGTVDLLGGRIDATMSSSMSVVLPHIRSGRLRALGVSAAARIQSLPDIPTIAETGLAGCEALQWAGLLAPAGTSRDIVQKLHKETVAYLRKPETIEFLARDSSIVVASAPEEFAAFIKAEMVKWAGVVKAAGIQPE